MNENPPASRGWRRVSRQTPCSVCGRPDWCTATRDGNVASCMRVPSQRQLGNGGWMHRLTEGRTNLPSSVNVTKLAPGLAPLEQRDRVYRAFIAELGLRPGHREHLEGTRGLPMHALDDFASAPPRAFSPRRLLVQRVIDRLGGSGDVLRGIPGFLVDRYGRWTCSAIPAGIMVPIRDPLWLIQALLVRFDSCGPGEPRYVWFSSRGKPGGSSPGAPAAFWEPGERTSEAVLLTEGPIKARVAGWHLQTRAIGVPGVSNWRQALDMLPGGESVVIAYDADARTNPGVARQQSALAKALFWAGHAVAIASWDPRCKGIDDAVLAGESIELTNWPRSGSSVPLHKRINPATGALAEAEE